MTVSVLGAAKVRRNGPVRILFCVYERVQQLLQVNLDAIIGDGTNSLCMETTMPVHYSATNLTYLPTKMHTFRDVACSWESLCPL